MGAHTKDSSGQPLLMPMVPGSSSRLKYFFWNWKPLTQPFSPTTAASSGLWMDIQQVIVNIHHTVLTPMAEQVEPLSPKPPESQLQLLVFKYVLYLLLKHLDAVTQGSFTRFNNVWPKLSEHHNHMFIFCHCFIQAGTLLLLLLLIIKLLNQRPRRHSECGAHFHDDYSLYCHFG